MLVVADDLTMLTGCHYMNSFPLTYIIDEVANPSFSEPSVALLLILISAETDHVFETYLGYWCHLLSWRVQQRY